MRQGERQSEFSSKESDTPNIWRLNFWLHYSTENHIQAQYHWMQNDISIHLSRANGFEIITNVSSVHMVQYTLGFSLPLPLRIAFIKQNTRTNKHQPFCIMNRILLLKMKTIMLDALWPSQNPNPMNERHFKWFFFCQMIWCLLCVYLWLGRLLSNI